jgi:hypothetical protein
MTNRRTWLQHGLRFGTLFLLGTSLIGCSKSEAPTPVEVGQIPAALREAFQGAKDPVAGLVADLIAAVEAREWPKASVAVQALSSATGLTKKQRETAARCLITINTQVNEAAATGNQQAEEVQRIIRTEK